MCTTSSAHSVAYVTLRLLESECSLDADWLSENLESAAIRCVDLLHKTIYGEEDVKVRTRIIHKSIFWWSGELSLIFTPDYYIYYRFI